MEHSEHYAQATWVVEQPVVASLVEVDNIGAVVVVADKQVAFVEDYTWAVREPAQQTVAVVSPLTEVYIGAVVLEILAVVPYIEEQEAVYTEA